jgi:biopolymer transport protein ExbD
MKCMPLRLLRHTLPLFSGSPGIIEAVSGDYASQRWSPRARRDERIRKRRSQYICQIDVSALLVIFLVLFITLMMYTPSGHGRGSVDLPKSEHASWLRAARREDAMRVSVSRDGKVYFDGRHITFDELPAQIREGLRGGAENRVYVYADARARYATVKAALTAIRLAGVEHVSFITESPRH